MRHLLTILFSFLIMGCHAQFRTLDWGTAEDTTTLKAYAGGARGMFVSEDTSLYVLCFPCTLTSGQVLQGVGTRKWLKIPRSSGSGSSTPYVDSLYQDGTTVYWTKNGNTYNFDVGDVDELDFRTTTQLTDTSFTLNRPNGTRDTVEFQLNYVDIDNLAYVDSIWRVAGKDSIFYSKQGNTYKLKDSTGTVATRDRFGYPSEDVTAAENRTFDLGSSYSLSLNGNRTTYIFNVMNTGGSAASFSSGATNNPAIYGTNSGQGAGISAVNTGTGIAGLFTSATASPIRGTVNSTATTNSWVTALELFANSTGTATTGFGPSISFTGGGATYGRISMVSANGDFTSSGTAANMSVILRDASGSFATKTAFKVLYTGDIEAPTAGQGLILTSPDGTKRVRISIDNTGAVTTTVL